MSPKNWSQWIYTVSYRTYIQKKTVFPYMVGLMIWNCKLADILRIVFLHCFLRKRTDFCYIILQIVLWLSSGRHITLFQTAGLAHRHDDECLYYSNKIIQESDCQFCSLKNLKCIRKFSTALTSRPLLRNRLPRKGLFAKKRSDYSSTSSQRPHFQIRLSSSAKTIVQNKGQVFFCPRDNIMGRHRPKI